MTRLVRLVVLAVAAGGLVAVPTRATAPPPTAPPPGAGTAVPVDSPVAGVVVTGQDLRITPGQRLHLELELRGDVQPTDTVYVDVAPILRRLDLQTVTDLDPTDSVSVDVATLGGAGARRTLDVPTEVLTAHDSTLTFDTPGLYAVRVALADQPLPSVTFVEVAGPSAATGALPVALVAGSAGGVTVDPDGTAHLDTEATRSIDSLTTALAACPAPMSVHLPAGVVEALGADEPRRRALAGALAGREVFSEPLLPLDASTAAATHQQEIFTTWLREGEDRANATLQLSTRRVVTLVDRPLSEPGAIMRRDLGSRLLLFTPAAFDVLPGTPGVFLDPTRVVAVGFASGTVLDATVPDRAIATILGSPSAPWSSPATTAASIVAQLLATRADLLASGADLTGRGVVVGTASLGVPPVAVLAELCRLVAATPELSPSRLGDLAGRLDPMTTGGDPLMVHLPATVSPLAARRTPAGDLRRQIAAVASMLPATDSRPAVWQHRLDVLPTTALDEHAAASLAASVQDDLADVLRAVVPPAPFNATLGGRSATLRLTIANTSDTPLRIRLHLSAGAAKVVFPDNDQIVELRPRSTTQVPAQIEARSNGRIPVLAELQTPQGDVVVGQPVPLTFTVNGLPGLGYLLSGAAGLILVTWWVRHHRRATSARRAGATLPGS